MHGIDGQLVRGRRRAGDGATIWSATQAVYPLKNTTATLLGLHRRACASSSRMGPGCYGINGADTVSYDAALLSQAVGRPVRVQLSRKDEMAWENYGFAYVIDQRVGLDADGTIVAGTTRRGRRRSADVRRQRHPGNVVTGMLAGFAAGGVRAAHAGAAARRTFNNGSNAAPSYVTGCVGGTTAAARAPSAASAC